MIPLLDSFIYPLMRKKFSSIISESTRLVFGMSLSALSIICAGLLESARLGIIHADPVHNSIPQTIGNTTYMAADLHILWQTPQYTLLGLGEVFCSVSCLYFAYSAAPKSMQSIIMGLFYFFSGLGSFLSSLAFWSFKSYIFSSNKNINDINCVNCYLNYYFYYIGCIQIIGVIVFAVLDHKCGLTRTKYSLSVTNLNKFIYDEANNAEQQFQYENFRPDLKDIASNNLVNT